MKNEDNNELLEEEMIEIESDEMGECFEDDFDEDLMRETERVNRGLGRRGYGVEDEENIENARAVRQADYNQGYKDGKASLVKSELDPRYDDNWTLLNIDERFSLISEEMGYEVTKEDFTEQSWQRFQFAPKERFIEFVEQQHKYEMKMQAEGLPVSPVQITLRKGEAVTDRGKGFLKFRPDRIIRDEL